MSERGAQQTVTPKSRRTRESIMQAAMRAVAKRGIEGITISHVASEAGLSRGTVYNYFETVQEILESIATSIEIRFNAAIDRANEGEQDPARRLANAVRQYFRKSISDPEWGRFICRFAITEESMRISMQQHAARDLQAGFQSGRFSMPADKMNAVFAILSGSALSTMGILADGMLPPSFAEDVIELLLCMLGIEPAEAKRIARDPLPELVEVDFDLDWLSRSAL